MNGNEKVNILMVDDQPASCSATKSSRRTGREPDQGHSGKEALEHLLKNDIAVVLMDVSMPEIDGFELADMIRQHPRFQKTAIIFISAVHLTDLDRSRATARRSGLHFRSGRSGTVAREGQRLRRTASQEPPARALNRELEQRVAERTAGIGTKSRWRCSSSTANSHQKNQELDAIVHTAPDIIFSRQADGARDYISEPIL